MRYMLILLGLFVTGTANAMDCQTLPDCESLGYSKDKDPNCAENGYMYCPFDQDYKVCVQYNCETLGFTETDKTSWCADLIECRGNQKMTLCQKPCIATKYEDLKELAESGKCKLITMKNDIAIPENQSITLHAGTTIDGGGHTIHLSATKGSLFNIEKNSTLRNLALDYETNQIQEAVYILDIPSETANLENIEISVSSSFANNVGLAIMKGIYNISGNFTVNTKVNSESGRCVLGYASSLTFNNAEISLNFMGNNGDIFMQNTSFINSQGQINTTGGGAMFVHSPIVQFKNSQITFETSLFYPANNPYPKFFLEEGSVITLKKPVLLDKGTGNLSFYLKGTNNAPSKLILDGNWENITNSTNDAKITTEIHATNMNDTLVYNGTTYHPTQTGTTLLSDVESSENWKKEQ